MLDNRLNMIAVDMSSPAGEEIRRIDQLYIDLDKELIKIGERSQVGHRNLHHARNHLENSLLHALKVLGLQFELKCN